MADAQVANYFLIDGEVDFGKTSPYCLTDNEKDEGRALLCQARALSYLVIHDQDNPNRDDLAVITPQDHAAQIGAVDQLNAPLWCEPLRLDSDQAGDWTICWVYNSSNRTGER
jgi:hypothetical protein